jgi:hypothetical protein
MARDKPVIWVKWEVEYFPDRDGQAKSQPGHTCKLTIGRRPMTRNRRG